MGAALQDTLHRPSAPSCSEPGTRHFSTWERLLARQRGPLDSFLDGRSRRQLGFLLSLLLWAAAAPAKVSFLLPGWQEPGMLGHSNETLEWTALSTNGPPAGFHRNKPQEVPSVADLTATDTFPRGPPHLDTTLREVLKAQYTALPWRLWPQLSNPCCHPLLFKEIFVVASKLEGKG